MVQLATKRQVRRSIRRRDFAPLAHPASPAVVRRLTREYHSEPKQPWRKWLWLSLAVFATGLIVALAYAPIFTIRNVIINGVAFKPTERRLAEVMRAIMLEKRWYVLPQGNLIFFSRDAAKKTLAKEFYINDVSFSKHWPNVLKLNVANNVIVAVWQTEQGSFLIDRRGVLVQQLMDLDNSQVLPLVHEQNGADRTLGEQVVKEHVAQFIDDLYVNWKQQLPANLPEYFQLDLAALPTLRAYMPEGWYVNVTGESEAKAQVENLKRLLEERIKDDRAKLQYIDVRFGNRLYFKLK